MWKRHVTKFAQNVNKQCPKNRPAVIIKDSDACRAMECADMLVAHADLRTNGDRQSVSLLFQHLKITEVCLLEVPAIACQRLTRGNTRAQLMVPLTHVTGT